MCECLECVEIRTGDLLRRLRGAPACEDACLARHPGAVQDDCRQRGDQDRGDGDQRDLPARHASGRDDVDRSHGPAGATPIASGGRYGGEGNWGAGQCQHDADRDGQYDADAWSPGAIGVRHAWLLGLGGTATVRHGAQKVIVAGFQELLVNVHGWFPLSWHWCTGRDRPAGEMSISERGCSFVERLLGWSGGGQTGPVPGQDASLASASRTRSARATARPSS